MPEVDDLEVRALHHHADQVLADVVKVALDRAHDGGLVRHVAGTDEERLEDRHGRLHGAGADEHLGYEDLLAREAVADDAHGFGHRVEDRERRDVLCERRLGDLYRCLAVTDLDRHL